MFNGFKRAVAVLAVAAAPLIGLAVASPASASVKPATFGCQNYQNGFCGDQVLPATGITPLAMDVYQGKAKVGNGVIVYPYSATDAAQDFIFKHFSGNPDNSKTFEYAPNGVNSGKCVSSPQVTAGTKLILRNCNEGPWQTFIPSGPNSFGNYTWSVEAGNPNLVITDSTSGLAGKQLALNYAVGSSYQEWAFTSGPPVQ
jgi:hypothetical protein